MRKTTGLAALLAGTSAALVATNTARAQEPVLEFAFEENVMLGHDIPVGETSRGTRLIIPITGGTFEGPGIKGEIMPMGWDWQLRRADGCTEVEADYFIRTDDGVVINVLNKGVLCPPDADGPVPVRTYPVFEAPRGKYEWLNKTAFVGTLEGAPDSPVRTVRIRFYRAK